MNNKKTVITGGGLSASTVLGIVFVVLKLVGVINWAWVWVLAPFWISLALSVLLIIIAILIAFIS